MPPVAKAAGLILIGLTPISLAAQIHRPSGQNPEPPRRTAEVHTWPSPGQTPGAGQDAPVWPRQTVRPVAYHAPVAAANGEASVPFSERVLGSTTVPRAAKEEGPSPLALRPPDSGLATALGPPAGPSRLDHGKGGRVGGLPTLLTVGSSLALVLGLFFVFAWFMRRTAPGGSGALPGEVVEVLGRAPLASRQNIHLLRCGRKLLLVSVTQAGVETLTEITEPDEVDRLAGLCKQAQPGSSSAIFRQVFQQFGQEGAGARLFGRGKREDVHLTGAGLPGHPDGTWEGRDV